MSSNYYSHQEQQQQQQQLNASNGGCEMNTTSAVGGGVGRSNGNLIAMKRTHLVVNDAQFQQQHQEQQQQQQLQQQQQSLHPDIIYEELPTDYCGVIESGDDGECEPAVVTVATHNQQQLQQQQQQQTQHGLVAKRPKYVSEIL